MRKLIINCLLAFSFITVYLTAQEKQQLKSEVNEGVELVYTVFKLSDHPQCTNGIFRSYDNDIDIYFAKYKNHEVVKLAKEYMQNYGVGYTAIYEPGIYLECTGSNVTLSDNIFKALDPQWNNDTTRWNKKRLKLFTKKLNDFYKKSDFRKFYDNHSEIYSESVARLNKGIENINLEWFEIFFGKEFALPPYVIFSMGVGNNNYGLSKLNNQGQKQCCPIIGTWMCDSLYLPMFDYQAIVPLLVHEISHPFTNPLVDKHVKLFDGVEEIIKPLYTDCTKYEPYLTWPILIYESLVRAITYEYLRENSADAPTLVNQRAKESKACFLWIGGLINNFSIYEENRKKYLTFESYMPQIAEYFNALKGQSFASPQIISSSIENGSLIDAGEVVLEIKFDKNMDTKLGIGFYFGKMGQETFPQFIEYKWLNKKTLYAKLKLESNKEYSLSLYQPVYFDAIGISLKDNLQIAFKTK